MKLQHTLMALAASTAFSHAVSIAINFAENDANQGFAGGANIGPTGINSSNWSEEPPVKPEAS